jgi:N-acetylglucosaminyldiphosphoundecaprenol N-acetyl-beta-D-mannosaminyltransferase
MQRWGLEWLFRLVQEPRRLWRRYVLLNPAYLALLAMELLGVHQVKSERLEPPERPSFYG